MQRENYRYSNVEYTYRSNLRRPAGEVTEVEAIAAEGLGGATWGVGCGNMRKRGYRN